MTCSISDTAQGGQTSGVAFDGVPGLFSGACGCLVENERNRQVSQGQKTLE